MYISYTFHAVLNAYVTSHLTKSTTPSIFFACTIFRNMFLKSTSTVAEIEASVIPSYFIFASRLTTLLKSNAVYIQATRTIGPLSAYLEESGSETNSCCISYTQTPHDKCLQSIYHGTCVLSTGQRKSELD